MNVTPIAVSTVQTETPALGTLTYYSLWITEQGFYTIEALYPSTVRVALFGPFATADGVIDDNAQQVFMDSGVGPLGCLPLKTGYYLLRVEQLGSGPYSVQLRPWRNLLGWTQTELERTDIGTILE